MKLRYICDCCEELINEVELSSGEEAWEALDALTGEEREDIMRMDFCGKTCTVISLCEDCSIAFGRREDLLFVPLPLLH